MSSAPPEEGRAPAEQVDAEPEAKAQKYQRSRFPYLQQFAAQAESPDGGRTLSAYRLRLGLRLGLATGRELALTIPRGCTGAELASLLRETAASIEQWVDDCNREGADPRNCAARRGYDQAGKCPDCGHAREHHATVTQPSRTHRDGSVTDPRRPKCAKCESMDRGRHASCKRAGCPMAEARAAEGQEAAFARVMGASAPPVQWCGPCSTAYQQAPGCPACRALADVHARTYGPQPADAGNDGPPVQGH